MNLKQLFSQHFPDYEFLFDFSLKDKSYFKIGGPAEVFYEAKTRQEAIALLLFCKHHQIKYSILGGASNVIIADEGLAGLVLSLHLTEIKLVAENDQELTYQADCGVKTSTLVAKVAAKGGSGLEGFIGVPGVLGGAIYNNAHYLNDLIGDRISEVEVFHVEKEEVLLFSREKCQFAYEKSIFQTDRNLVIFSATFALKKFLPDEIKQRVRDSIEKRELTQPLHMPSCGCVFQNPANTEELKQLFPQFSEAAFIPAGFLIDQAGLKGVKEGDIQISEKHAAFFVNLGNGRAIDVANLVEKVKTVVFKKFGVILREEVFYLK